MEEKKDIKEETYDIKIDFYGEKLDFKLTSDYNSFIKNISDILKIPSDQLNSICLSYNDEDGDSIMISTQEDFSIFVQQVKEKITNLLIIEINENSKIDPIDLMNSALNYQDQIAQANNEINNQNNKENNNNNINNNEELNINNIDNKDKDNNNIINNEENKKYEEPIDNIIFNCQCSSCSDYPIVCKVYHCPECNIFLCKDCYKNVGRHHHSINEIESKEEFLKLVNKENDKKDPNNPIYNNFNNNYYSYNDNYDYYNNYNNDDYCDCEECRNRMYYNSQYNYPYNMNNNNNNYSYHQNHFPNYTGFPLLDIFNTSFNPFKDLKKKKKDLINKKNFKIVGRKIMDLGNRMKYMKTIHEARKTYKLDGIDDKRLLEALEKTNGDIDKALIELAK